MVMTYEAYVIHYASSSQPVTMLCLSVEAFCAPCKSKIEGENLWKCQFKAPPALAYINGAVSTISWFGFQRPFMFFVQEKGKSRFGFLLPTAKKCADCDFALSLLQHDETALCCKKKNDNNLHTNTTVTGP